MSTDTKPTDLLKQAGQEALQALGSRITSSIGDRVGSLTDHLDSVADGGPLKKAVAKGAEAKAKGDSPVMGGLKGAVSGVKDKLTGGGGKSGGGKAAKSTNIEETIDVGVPVRVAYNQWTEFGAFPSFMKKVENVEAPDDTKLTWKAQIFLSHRTWEATILEQVPDSHIVWRSKGEKGHVDGAVTFHELTPDLTRILVTLEYYPQGLFEKTGNIWEAQGRRARAELRHFRRHVMTRTILNPDEVEGWRGTIEDGEVVETHEEALEREEQEEQESQSDEDTDGGTEGDTDGDTGEDYDEPEDEADEESDEEPTEDEYDDEDADESDEDAEDEPAEDEYDEELDDESEEEPVEDEYDEEEPEDEADDETAEDEYDDEEEYDDEPVDEDEEEPDEDERPRRRRRSA